MKLTASLRAGRSSRPRPPAHPFLLEEKDAKDHSGGVCGLPLKTPGRSHRSQRYIRYAPRVRVCAGWHALTVPGAAQRCGTSFQRLVCEDPPVRKCLRISERVRAVGAHKGPRRARPSQGSSGVSIEGCKPSRDEPLSARLGRNGGGYTPRFPNCSRPKQANQPTGQLSDSEEAQ